mmetsp:Transcript_92102/g.206211  ORF Transcript_92102/g.206211 Transcript_92102/m.206211 type:complete len:170 (-) Transcript_92102:205-714(-)
MGRAASRSRSRRRRNSRSPSRRHRRSDSRRERREPRERSAPRSPPRSPPRASSAPASKSKASQSPDRNAHKDDESKNAPPTGKYEIEDGAPKANGTATWRAMILVPRPQRGEARPGAPPGTICIRGPNRPDRSLAEEDGEELEKAAAVGDMRHLREVQQRLTRAQQLMH